MLRDSSVVYPNEYPIDVVEKPIWLAAKCGQCDEVLKSISNGEGIEERGGYMHCTPLLIASAYDNLDVVTLLIEHCADLLSKDLYYLETPLHASLRRYNARTADAKQGSEVSSVLINAMVKRGFTLDSVDECGRTALHLAVVDNNESMIKHLLNNGADISARDQAGTTALKYSILEHNLNVTLILIKYGVNVNERYHHGRIPVHLCTHSGTEELCRLLLAHGADIKAVDYGGLNALSIISQHEWVGGIDIINRESARRNELV
jgi:ankyrin repeat protein